MLIRKTFPQVYKYFDSKTGNPYFQVSARSAKWGMNERKTFTAEKDALEHARKIAELIEKRGAQPQMSKEKAAMADDYLTLADKMKPHGKTPEDAVEHYIKFLGNEIIRQALPSISELADKWQAFKFFSKTVYCLEPSTKKTSLTVPRDVKAIFVPDNPARHIRLPQGFAFAQILHM